MQTELLQPAAYRGKRAAVRHPALTEYQGLVLEEGQVFTLAGAGNDERLVRLGYVDVVGEKERALACRRCGKEFRSENARNAHGARAHRPADAAKTERTPQREDLDRDDLVAGVDEATDAAEKAPPLYLDKTAAAKGAKPAAGR